MEKPTIEGDVVAMVEGYQDPVFYKKNWILLPECFLVVCKLDGSKMVI